MVLRLFFYFLANRTNCRAYIVTKPYAVVGRQW